MRKLLPFLYVGITLKSEERGLETVCPAGRVQRGVWMVNVPHLEEESVTGGDLILDGDDSVRGGEDGAGDAVRLPLHQLLLLLVLLLQGGQPSRLLLLQKLPQLLELLSDLLLCDLSLVLEDMRVQTLNVQ